MRLDLLRNTMELRELKVNAAKFRTKQVNAEVCCKFQYDRLT